MAALESRLYDHEQPSLMSKEDFGNITTTQEGILNTLQVMSNAIANHTDIILKKLKKYRGKKEKFQRCLNATPERKDTFHRNALTKTKK